MKQTFLKNNFFDIIVTINSHKINSEQLKYFVENGATLFRLNGAFLSLNEIEENINRIRNAVNNKIKIILDLPGYKIRFLNLPEEIRFRENIPFSLPKQVFNYPQFINVIKPGTAMRLNDGMDKFVVQKIDDDSIQCVAAKGGKIKKGKGLHLDGISYRPSTNSLSGLDDVLIEMARKSDIDYVGLSFVYDREDIEYVRRKLEGTSVKCIPKIESKQSLGNLGEILKDSEMIIIDRGDLAGEIGLENVWQRQRDIISLAKVYDTKVIVATQILSSMTENPIPSIAEVDSLYSLLDFGIDGIQLSDETCIGRYAEQAVCFIKDIVDKKKKNGRNVRPERGSVIWLMGPTSSGKTTIAEKVVTRLREVNIEMFHYDGDEIRDLFGPDLGFSRKERLSVVRSLTHLANKVTSRGINVIVSALTAYDDARQYIDQNVKGLLKVFVQCDLDECKKRDSKGLYEKALNGEIDTLIGYNSPYVPPDDPDLILHSQTQSPSESADEIIHFLIEHRLISFW